MEYQKYEFCKAMNCVYLKEKCSQTNGGCHYTAKQFHKWLKKHDFTITGKA